MSTTTTIGYAAAGVIVAISAVTATVATVGLGGGGTDATTSPVATAGAGQALVTTPGGSTIPLAPGEQITSTEVVQTPAGPVEYVYVDAAPARARGDDDDHDEDDEDERAEHSRTSRHDDDDDEHEDHEERESRESRSSIRGDRR